MIQQEKKVYQRPELYYHGSVEEITLQYYDSSYSSRKKRKTGS
jgi:hypothetical protein